MIDAHRSIIARIKPILDAAYIEYAHAYPTSIPRMRSWSGGVVVEKRKDPTLVYQIVCPGSYGKAAAASVAAAVRACREAGWTVDDDGTIRELPPKPTRTKAKT